MKNETKKVKEVKLIKCEIITAKPEKGFVVESIEFTSKSESACIRSAGVKLGCCDPIEVADEYAYSIKNKIQDKFKEQGMFGGVYITNEDGTKKQIC